jgi:hypothetical protein
MDRFKFGKLQTVMQKMYITKFTFVIVIAIFSFQKYVIVLDSLKKCYLYIRTCNHNESEINKFNKLQL